MKSNTTIIGALVALVLVGSTAFMYFFSPRDAAAPHLENSGEVTSGETATSTDEIPVPDHSADAKKDLIVVTAPFDGDAIESPLTIKGNARGYWFFEGSFPVTLTDWDGLIIAEGYATAEGDWMTEAFVPFTSTLTFTKPAYGERGSLILRKDNPSGLPEFDDALEMQVIFK